MLSQRGMAALNFAAPFEIMKFTLTFEGDLPASGNKPKPDAVWQIRRALHPQIKELFQTHPVILPVVERPYFFPHVMVQGAPFCPLVRQHLSMICHVDIIFLRRGEVGSLVRQDGDVDNRIKTLFDGLRMPNPTGESFAESQLVDEEPMFSLLESDALITGFSVKTDRLLNCSTHSEKWVKLLLEVRVSVTQVTMANVSFLGD